MNIDESKIAMVKASHGAGLIEMAEKRKNRIFNSSIEMVLLQENQGVNID